MDRKPATARPGRVLRLAAGWALTLAGIVLWLLPLVPGFFLLIPGIGILCAESRWLRGPFTATIRCPSGDQTGVS